MGAIIPLSQGYQNISKTSVNFGAGLGYFGRKDGFYVLFLYRMIARMIWMQIKNVSISQIISEGENDFAAWVDVCAL